MPRFYEFFAGGGMARLGLGEQWTCLFANDFDESKCESYARNWGDSELLRGDVAELTAADLPGVAELAWASFPCQDLSQAGSGAGLNGERSGTFWPFWHLIEALRDEGRAPRMVVLENVPGALTSHSGRDFAAIGDAVAGAGYRFGALVVDAVRFVPQSRPRLFVIATDRKLPIPDSVRRPGPDPLWSPRSLVRATFGLDSVARSAWVWWRLPVPPPRRTELANLVDPDPDGVPWHSPAETQRFLDMMTTVNRAKVEKRSGPGCRPSARSTDEPERTTPVWDGSAREIRFDGISGCLRTGSGGSSRQFIMTVRGSRIRSRLLSAREAARLMGLPDDYQFPANYREAYHLAGDGVVVPVVRHIAAHILEPVLASASRVSREAA